MSDFPFSIPRGGDGDVVNGVSYAGDTLTLTRAEGSDLTTTISTAAPPFSHKQVSVPSFISVPGPWTPTASNETKLTSLSGLTITPNSASEKVILRLHLFGEWSAGSQQCSLSFKRVVGTQETWLDPRVGIGNRKPCNAMFALTFSGDNNVSTPQSLNTSLIDEPNTTQQVTYDIYLLNGSSTSTYNLNRTTNDTDEIHYERGISTFTAECKG